VIDPQILRDSPELIRKSLLARAGSPDLVDIAQAADQARRDAISEFEALRSEQNAIGKDVAKASGAEKQALLASVKELSERVKQANTRVSEAEAHAEVALGALPNLVIDGCSSRWG
jgi:seryl-tRNA synthetase